MMLLVIIGFMLGTASLFLVHRELSKRLSAPRSWLLVELVVLASSFAIFLGRDLRWNSWDIIVNPGDVAADILDRVFNPFDHFGTWAVTLLFGSFFCM